MCAALVLLEWDTMLCVCCSGITRMGYNVVCVAVVLPEWYTILCGLVWYYQNGANAVCVALVLPELYTRMCSCGSGIIKMI